MKRYQCGDFGVPSRRPWGPPGCCPPACPPPCQPTCPPVMPEPCPPQPCPPTDPLRLWVRTHALGAGRVLPGRAAGDLQRLPLCGKRRQRRRGSGGVGRLYPAVHPAAGGPHRACRSRRPHGAHRPCRTARRTRPNRAPRGNGAHGSHGSPNRWTTARKNGGNLGEFGALLMQNIPYNIQTV